MTIRHNSHEGPWIEWWGGPNDADHVHVTKEVIESGVLRLPDLRRIRSDDWLDETKIPLFSDQPGAIEYPIRLLSVKDAVTGRRHEKYMIDYYNRSPK